MFADLDNYKWCGIYGHGGVAKAFLESTSSNKARNPLSDLSLKQN